jgi:hypothetical protein
MVFTVGKRANVQLEGVSEVLERDKKQVTHAVVAWERSDNRATEVSLCFCNCTTLPSLLLLYNLRVYSLKPLGYVKKKGSRILSATRAKRGRRKVGRGVVNYCKQYIYVDVNCNFKHNSLCPTGWLEPTW